MLKAALTTTKAACAIAAVEIFGDNAICALDNIFTPCTKEKNLRPQHFSFGKIKQGQRVIDDVVIHCQNENSITINMHGSTFIVKDILELLKTKGVEVVSADEIIKNKLNSDTSLSILQKEAAFFQLKAMSLTGVKLIANQLNDGLYKWTNQWLKILNNENTASLKSQTEFILKKSITAYHIIHGFKIVIVGAPNSGKSTLLNTIAGRNVSIVSQMQGTTRDWVSAECIIANEKVTFIDTAGIQEHFTKEPDVMAQDKTIQMIKTADAIWLLIDAASKTETAAENCRKILKENLKNIPVITIYNKIDKTDFIPDGLRISAIENVGIDAVINYTFRILAIDGFDIYQPICFTKRQRTIIKNLTQTEKTDDIKNLLETLINDKTLLL